MAQNKNAMVADYWDQGSCWNLLVRRYLNDSKKDEMARLLSILDPIIIDPEKLDERWLREENGRFSVRSCYALLEMGRSWPLTNNPFGAVFPMDSL